MILTENRQKKYFEVSPAIGINRGIFGPCGIRWPTEPPQKVPSPLRLTQSLIGRHTSPYSGTLASEAVVGVYSPAQGFLPTLQVEERPGCPFQALGKRAKIILPIVAANQDVVGHLAEKVHPEIVKPSGENRS
ncbi:hypothetical protein [Mesorhizobium sp. LSJC264A00]|uniref:hypothetical protein n=1 Tax=unclassified Mesorhizobium TaxID=325217 RepID=UPI0012EC7D82|nr:hypothetical protein [Mesorhizobium sp. LSJC264A00]